MKYRIRKIDSRDYGNQFLAQSHEFMHIIEKCVMRKRYVFFGALEPHWVRIGGAISLECAQRDMNKIITGEGVRPVKHHEPVVVKEYDA